MPLQPQSFTGVDMTGLTFDTVRLSKSRFTVRFDGATFEVGSFRDIVMKVRSTSSTWRSGAMSSTSSTASTVGLLITAERLNCRDPERYLPVVRRIARGVRRGLPRGAEVVVAGGVETIDRVRAMPEGSEHESVDGE